MRLNTCPSIWLNSRRRKISAARLADKAAILASAAMPPGRGEGKVRGVNFKEGKDVEKDLVLAEIDAKIYQAQYDQVVAKKKLDEAQLANARLDLERYTRLAQTNSASRQQYDTQRALVAQLEGQVQADQGAIDYAKAILSYTKIIAPLAGRTRIRQVDPANIVHAADTTGIVGITQIKPIAVIFT